MAFLLQFSIDVINRGVIFRGNEVVINAHSLARGINPVFPQQLNCSFTHSLWSFIIWQMKCFICMSRLLSTVPKLYLQAQCLVSAFFRLLASLKVSLLFHLSVGRVGRL